MAWKDQIEALKAEWTGKKVTYDGKVYTVVNVDYNGILHIDKSSEHNPTTAVYEPHEAKKSLVH